MSHAINCLTDYWICILIVQFLRLNCLFSTRRIYQLIVNFILVWNNSGTTSHQTFLFSVSWECCFTSRKSWCLSWQFSWAHFICHLSVYFFVIRWPQIGNLIIFNFLFPLRHLGLWPIWHLIVLRFLGAIKFIKDAPLCFYCLESIIVVSFNLFNVILC